MRARPVRRGCFHVTLSNVRRLFLMKPGGQVRLKKVIWYLIAYVAKKYGLLIHEITVMSNHLHIFFTDVYGNRPAAMALLNALLARQINALRGESGTVFETYWAGEKLDCAASLATAVYVLCNPVKDHIVERAREWIGVSTLKMEYGDKMTIRRPPVGLWADLDTKRKDHERRAPMSPGRAKYRGKPSTMPDEVTLELVRPTCYPELSDAQLRSEVRTRLSGEETRLMAERKVSGKSVLGIEGLRELAANEGPSRSSKSRRELMREVPRYAGAPTLITERKAQDRDFDRRYKMALERLLKGEREAIWPEYTWKMRVHYRLPCEGTPTWPRSDAMTELVA